MTPQTETPTLPPRAQSGVVNCVAYERGVRTGDIELGDIQTALQRPDTFVWIGLVDPDEALLRTVAVRGAAVGQVVG